MFNKSRAFASTVPATQPASSPEDAMKQALCSVVQVWLDRLQSMAVVTTFFVSIDSLLFSLTASTRSADLKAWSMRDQVINASLGGAIIFHAFAAIVAYIGSYVLIRFRLNNAEKVEERTEGQYTTAPARPSAEKRRMKSSHRQSISAASTAAPMSPTDTIRDFPLEVFTDLRSLVDVHRVDPLRFLPCCTRRRAKRKTDPEASVKDAAIAGLENIVGVLSRAHNVSAAMASLGFILALLGILTYSWTAVPTSLSIFASVCMGVCLLAALVAFR
ncbi:hypothetical protein PYCCODRAFT_1414675 [Trametes coccinea BRFM310]|uniref:Transmembrane protein n=1 Tax=Trametes coccinea (strain BRFM310) TaxID=1353009 RepID=A0A1Y2IGN2_TRAC3|nr:hypothetical protein PYCCODRAFT_1414675 [Trametes coccinea BRFM310]